MYCKFYEQVGACVHELDDPRCTKIHREDLCSEVVIVRGYHELRLGNVDGTYEVYFKQFRNIFGNVGFFNLIGNRGLHLRGGFLLKLFSTEMASDAVNFFNNIDGVYARLWHCRSNLNSAVCFSYVPGWVDVEKLACTIKRFSFCTKGDLCHFLHFLPISLLLLQRDALMPFARNGHGIKCGNARVGGWSAQGRLLHESQAPDEIFIWFPRRPRQTQAQRAAKASWLHRDDAAVVAQDGARWSSTNTRTKLARTWWRLYTVAGRSSGIWTRKCWRREWSRRSSGPRRERIERNTRRYLASTLGPYWRNL